MPIGRLVTSVRPVGQSSQDERGTHCTDKCVETLKCSCSMLIAPTEVALVLSALGLVSFTLAHPTMVCGLPSSLTISAITHLFARRRKRMTSSQLRTYELCLVREKKSLMHCQRIKKGKTLTMWGLIARLGTSYPLEAIRTQTPSNHRRPKP